jgi:hypothetical protein
MMSILLIRLGHRLMCGQVSSIERVRDIRTRPLSVDQRVSS